jgi:hypothetical protein
LKTTPGPPAAAAHSDGDSREVFPELSASNDDPPPSPLVVVPPEGPAAVARARARGVRVRVRGVFEVLVGRAGAAVVSSSVVRRSGDGPRGRRVRGRALFRVPRAPGAAAELRERQLAV